LKIINTLILVFEKVDIFRKRKNWLSTRYTDIEEKLLISILTNKATIPQE